MTMDDSRPDDVPNHRPNGERGSLRVALLQLAVEDGAPARNAARAFDLLRGAPDADLYLLPELWTTGYAHASWPAAADESTPKVAAELQRIADERGAVLGGSMIARRDDGALVNRFWLFAPNGLPDAGADAEPVWYDKAHLFAPMGEPEHLAAGDRRVRADVAGADVALSVCFDLRFPEMYRHDAADGAALFLVVSAWPHPRAETLRLLARARAVENQAALVLCNRAGSGADGTAFCGGSCVIAPDGSVVADAGEEETVLIAEVDVAAVSRLRQRFPVLTARAPAVDDRSGTPAAV